MNPYDLCRGVLWVDPRSQAQEWVNSQPATTERWIVKDKIANKAQAKWVGYGDARSQIEQDLKDSYSQGSLPVFSLYAIPFRDLGGQSAGGAPDFPSYAKWIDSVASVLGNYPAVVILETDSLMQVSELPAVERVDRLACLNHAVHTFARRCPNVFVYLDGGDGRWHDASKMAYWLIRAGVSGARGFSINVSNYNTTETCANMADKINEELARVYGYASARYVIDTSRNGKGPGLVGKWCNAPGRKLGGAPVVVSGLTGSTRLDADLWIKRPGESDGNCGAYPGVPSGVFDPRIAVNLYYGR